MMCSFGDSYYYHYHYYHSWCTTVYSWNADQWNNAVVVVVAT